MSDKQGLRKEVIYSSPDEYLHATYPKSAPKTHQNSEHQWTEVFRLKEAPKENADTKNVKDLFIKRTRAAGGC